MKLFSNTLVVTKTYPRLNQLLPVALAIVVFGGLGSWLLVNSHAATPTASLQAENGTVSTKAGLLSDTSASGLQVVKFGTSSGTGSGSNCSATPSSCGYPDGTTTGVPAGTTLSSRGSLTVSSGGTAANPIVYSGLNITGCVDINASYVTLKNSIIHEQGCTSNPEQGNAVLGIAYDVTGVLIDHVEVAGVHSGGEGIAGGGFTLNAVNVHDTADGIDVSSNSIIQNSYVHDIVVYPTDAHVDGIQTNGSDNVVVRHNTVFNPNEDTSAIMIGADAGSISYFTVDDNFLAGGVYTLYGGQGGGHPLDHIIVTNNKFSTKFFPNSSRPNNPVGAGNPTAYCLATNAQKGYAWGVNPSTGQAAPNTYYDYNNGWVTTYHNSSKIDSTTISC